MSLQQTALDGAVTPAQSPGSHGWLASRRSQRPALSSPRSVYFCDSIAIWRGCTGKPKRVESTLFSGRPALESRVLSTVGCRDPKAQRPESCKSRCTRGNIFASSVMRKSFLYHHTCHAGLTRTRLVCWHHSMIQKAEDDTFTATDLPLFSNLARTLCYGKTCGRALDDCHLSHCKHLEVMMDI